jgi:putative aminopeptidase FrvX
MKFEIQSILNIANDFLQVPATIEHEKPFLDYLQKKIETLGYEIIRNEKYLVIKPKNKRAKYLFSAHVDRHGFIINDEKEFEHICYYYKKKYGLEFKKDYFEFFLSCAQRHTRDEIYSYEKETGKKLNTFKTTRYNLDWKNKLVTFDLDKEINQNDKVFAIDSKIIQSKNIFYGQIDNVISVALIYYLLEKGDFNHEIIFTTREEIGKSYENVVDYLSNIDYDLKIITLDTSPYENFKKQEEGFLTLRKGDENGNFDLEFVAEIEDLLKKKNVPMHYKSSTIGMTELGRISTSTKGDYNGATIQLPTLNYHTSYETATIKSMKNYYYIVSILSQN